MHFRRSQSSSGPTVFDAFGVKLGYVLREEPDRLLVGTEGQPALWLSRRAIMWTNGETVTLACARNRIGNFAIRANVRNDGPDEPAGEAAF